MAVVRSGRGQCTESEPLSFRFPFGPTFADWGVFETAAVAVCKVTFNGLPKVLAAGAFAITESTFEFFTDVLPLGFALVVAKQWLFPCTDVMLLRSVGSFVSFEWSQVSRLSR